MNSRIFPIQHSIDNWLSEYNIIGEKYQYVVMLYAPLWRSSSYASSSFEKKHAENKHDKFMTMCSICHCFWTESIARYSLSFIAIMSYQQIIHSSILFNDIKKTIIDKSEILIGCTAHIRSSYMFISIDFIAFINCYFFFASLFYRLDRKLIYRKFVGLAG